MMSEIYDLAVDPLPLFLCNNELGAGRNKRKKSTTRNLPLLEVPLVVCHLMPKQAKLVVGLLELLAALRQLSGLNLRVQFTETAFVVGAIGAVGTLRRVPIDNKTDSTIVNGAKEHFSASTNHLVLRVQL